MPLLLCPNCNVSMQNVARSGVELDMCPSCRGVWLDRGELEKILGAGRETQQGDIQAPGKQPFLHRKNLIGLKFSTFFEQSRYATKSLRFFSPCFINSNTIYMKEKQWQI